jgi:hypothetical protein
MSNQTVKSQPKNTLNHVNQPSTNPRYEIPVDHACSDRTIGNRMIVTRLAAYITGRLAFEYCLSDEDIASPNIAQRVIEDAIMEVLDKVDMIGLKELSQQK